MHSDDKFFFRLLYFGLFLVSLLWLVEGLQYILDTDFHKLGIYPRTLKGSVGVVTGPWIHGDIYHLFSNSFPLLFLGISIAFFYRKIAIELFFWMYLFTGLAVWLFGRPAFHIGASGVIYAMIGFLLFSGLFRKDIQSGAIAFAFLFLYGGVLQGMFPTAVEPHVSWESHLLGAAVGAALAFIYRNSDTIENDDPPENDDEDPVSFSNSGEYTYVFKSK